MSANSPKYRDYQITANKGADCYEDLEEIVKNKCNFNIYALIVHDKDIEINEQGEQKPKQTHKHLNIELQNPVSFNSMQKKFKGAHIEVIKYKKSAYQYLVHNSPNSSEKYQYSLDEIITNNREQVECIINSPELEIFSGDLLAQYIAEGTTTKYAFLKRFGIDAYKSYSKVFFEFVEIYQNELDEQLCEEVETWKKQ